MCVEWSDVHLAGLQERNVSHLDLGISDLGKSASIFNKRMYGLKIAKNFPHL